MSRPARFARGLRWFAAEFAVVVSGVLVALALQAWYQSRQDARASPPTREVMMAAVLFVRVKSDLDPEEGPFEGLEGRLAT